MERYQASLDTLKHQTAAISDLMLRERRKKTLPQSQAPTSERDARRPPQVHKLRLSDSAEDRDLRRSSSRN